MKRKIFVLLIVGFFGLNTPSLVGQDTTSVVLSHGEKGFELKTADDKYKLQLQTRFQFRYATPYDGNPRTYAQLLAPDRQIAKINRAILKVGGNAYSPDLKFYLEYDVNRNALLDYRVMFEKWKWLKLKVGQWKIEYSRERLISSGKQQTVDRSLINSYFTLDRQQGITLYGNVGNDGLANFSYWAAVLTGSGRSARSNPTNDLMYSGRLQWNFCGREMVMEGSDTKTHQKGIGSIAVAGATYKGPYNMFSSAGGSTYTPTIDSIIPYFDVKQINFETAYMKKGFSWQHESHLKWIDDEVNNTDEYWAGTYLQAGYFFHEVFSRFPENLEIAGRYAVFTPDIKSQDYFQNEYSLAVNYFFNGHLNKLTAEITRFEFDDVVEGNDGRYRFRIQWDISF